MAERIVVSLHLRGAGSSESGYVRRALAARKRAEALGAVLAAWGPEAFAFDFAPEEVEEAVDLARATFDDPLLADPAFGAGVAFGELERVGGGGSLGMLAWGAPLALAWRLSQVAEPGEVLIDGRCPAHLADALRVRGERRLEPEAWTALVLDTRHPFRRDTLVDSLGGTESKVRVTVPPLPSIHALSRELWERGTSPSSVPSSARERRPPSEPPPTDRSTAPPTIRNPPPSMAGMVAPDVLAQAIVLPRGPLQAPPSEPSSSLEPSSSPEPSPSEPGVPSPSEASAGATSSSEPPPPTAPPPTAPAHAPPSQARRGPSPVPSEPSSSQARRGPSPVPSEPSQARRGPSPVPSEPSQARRGPSPVPSEPSPRRAPAGASPSQMPSEPAPSQMPSEPAPSGERVAVMPPLPPVGVPPPRLPSAQTAPTVPPPGSAVHPVSPSHPPLAAGRISWPGTSKEYGELTAAARQALLEGNVTELERLADELKSRGEADLADRMAGFVAWNRGAKAEGLRKLRVAADAETRPAHRVRALLAYGVALAASGRTDASLLAALGALARAREVADRQGEHVCARFLARLSAASGYERAARVWAALADELVPPRSA